LLTENIKIKIYRTVILPLVLYGCETWALTLREELRLMVFDNRVLRKIFGPQADGVTGSGEKCITRREILFKMQLLFNCRIKSFLYRCKVKQSHFRRGQALSIPVG